MTAHYLCHDTYAVREGDDVLVHAAAGGVGLLLVQMVKQRGGRVIATTSTEEKAELARRAGADEVIGYEGFPERVRELTGGAGVHVAYDAVGRTTFEDSLDSLRRRGYIVLYGEASGRPTRSRRNACAGSRSTSRAPACRVHRHARGAARAGRRGPELGGRGQARRAGGRPLSARDARRAHEDLEARRTTGSCCWSLSRGRRRRSATG